MLTESGSKYKKASNNTFSKSVETIMASNGIGWGAAGQKAQIKADNRVY